jgi:aminoglycoside phosphotransferase (APT) family kinase protein
VSEQWRAEIDVDEPLARGLIESQWPQLRGESMRRFGEGWDNSAYLIGERIVFRFPRRTIAVPLIAHEIELLPTLAPELPIAIPNPTYAGVASASYPWPFAGYALLPGETACSRELSDRDRLQLASDLGKFLRALHGIDVAALTGLRRDTFGKMRPELLGIDEPALPFEERVVHGDLYARHLLLDEKNRLCGVIDWGDLHRGPTAVDLSVIHMMIPPIHHDAFFASYGPVDERTWRFARYRARHHARNVLRYAESVGDASLRNAAETALSFSES